MSRLRGAKVQRSRGPLMRSRMKLLQLCAVSEWPNVTRLSARRKFVLMRRPSALHATAQQDRQTSVGESTGIRYIGRALKWDLTVKEALRSPNPTCALLPVTSAPIERTSRLLYHPHRSSQHALLRTSRSNPLARGRDWPAPLLHTHQSRFHWHVLPAVRLRWTMPIRQRQKRRIQPYHSTFVHELQASIQDDRSMQPHGLFEWMSRWRHESQSVHLS